MKEIRRGEKPASPSSCKFRQGGKGKKVKSETLGRLSARPRGVKEKKIKKRGGKGKKENSFFKRVVGKGGRGIGAE